MGLEFKNDLNVPVEVYFYYDDGGNEIIRGAGMGDSSSDHKYEVEADGGLLHLDLRGLTNSFEMHIRVNEMPKKNNIEGIIVDRGEYIGKSRETEIRQMEDHVLIIIFYDGEPYKNRPGEDMTHIDPRVRHPPRNS